MVFAMSRHNMNASIPCIFRSYQGAANQMPDCAIWEVLCASMAHPDLFKSVEIGEDAVRESFVDGGLGCSNPTPHVLTEAKTIFPGRSVSCIMSIGTGHTRTIQLPRPNVLQQVLPTHIIMAMKDIATDSERVAEDMAVRFRWVANVYFRFSVGQGMQNIKLSDWEKLDEVAAHTRAYMRRAEASQRIDQAVEAMKERKATLSVMQIGTNMVAPPFV
jgi:predicted acylesterase/phospholipase RssA